MTEERLKHLAATAALGVQTPQEQLECMEALHEAYDLLDLRHVVSVQTISNQDRYRALAAAAKLPPPDETPQRKPCEACGGSGHVAAWGDEICVGGDVHSCPVCHGTGYISEDQK